jgi:hypothetical protein
MADSRSREMLLGFGVRDRSPPCDRFAAEGDVFGARRFVVLGMIAGRDRVSGDVVYYSASARPGRSTT